MVKRVKFERGDIVRVNLNPTGGREQQGGDFARFAGFAVPLSGFGTETQGGLGQQYARDGLGGAWSEAHRDGAVPEKFAFTVPDEAVAQQLLANAGKRVVLTYSQHK